MVWHQLGLIPMGSNSLDDWRATDLSATDQELIRVSWMVGQSFPELQSRLLVRRRWQMASGPITVEKAILLYPSVEPQIIRKEIPPQYTAAGFDSFRVEVKRTAQFRYYGLFEPAYSVLVEVANV